MSYFLEIAKGIMEAYGYYGIFFLTAIEQFIFPIPADVFVGFGTSIGLSFSSVLAVVIVAAIIGSIIGYYLGKWIGHPIMTWLFGKEKIEEAEKFVKKWGIWGVIGAGISPIPFKLVTWSAGIFEMPFYKFMIGVLLGRIPRYLVTAYAGTIIYKTGFYASMDMSAVILGIFQGITEFLPISSSGHLVIMEHFLKIPFTADKMITFDILLHGGSLAAIVIYFWKDWWQVLKEMWKAGNDFQIGQRFSFFKTCSGNDSSYFCRSLVR